MTKESNTGQWRGVKRQQGGAKGQWEALNGGALNGDWKRLNGNDEALKGNEEALKFNEEALKGNEEALKR